MPEDIVPTILRDIQSDLAGLKRDVATLKQQGATNARAIGLLHQDVRMIRSAVNDIAHSHVSTGEVEALHSDVNSLLERMTLVEARLDTMESNE